MSPQLRALEQGMVLEQEQALAADRGQDQVPDQVPAAELASKEDKVRDAGTAWMTPARLAYRARDVRSGLLRYLKADEAMDCIFLPFRRSHDLH